MDVAVSPLGGGEFPSLNQPSATSNRQFCSVQPVGFRSDAEAPDACQDGGDGEEQGERGKDWAAAELGNAPEDRHHAEPGKNHAEADPSGATEGIKVLLVPEPGEQPGAREWGG